MVDTMSRRQPMHPTERLSKKQMPGVMATARLPPAPSLADHRPGLPFTHPYGFDGQQTLPCRYWLGEKLRRLDRGLLQEFLAAMVQALQAEIPGLGEVVSFDVRHIYAWVQESNACLRPRAL